MKLSRTAASLLYSRGRGVLSAPLPGNSSPGTGNQGTTLSFGYGRRSGMAAMGLAAHTIAIEDAAPDRRMRYR